MMSSSIIDVVSTAIRSCEVVIHLVLVVFITAILRPSVMIALDSSCIVLIRIKSYNSCSHMLSTIMHLVVMHNNNVDHKR